ncbi:hypothetical protein JOD96_001858 [Flavobacterium sp. 1355]|nr:hypothetical protein [Flavobacterium sp. 1355]
MKSKNTEISFNRLPVHNYITKSDGNVCEAFKGANAIILPQFFQYTFIFK